MLFCGHSRSNSQIHRVWVGNVEGHPEAQHPGTLASDDESFGLPLIIEAKGVAEFGDDGFGHHGDIADGSCIDDGFGG